MRRLMVESLALTLVLAGVSLGLGQSQPGQSPGGLPGGQPQSGMPPGQKAPAKSKLEEMLAEALRNNPDIRVAAAKVAEADAELNRTRLQVAQKVVALYYAIDTQQKVVAHEEVKVRRIERLKNANAMSKEEVADVQQALTLAKAKLAELEAQEPALLGKAALGVRGKATEALLAGPRVYPLIGVAELIRTPRGEVEIVVKNSQQAAGPMADKIRKALQTPVKADYKDESFDAILKDLARKVDGLSFRNLFERGGGNFPSQKKSLRFEEALPLSAILQALADETECTFVVRDYGILAIAAKNAPPGAMTVQEFLRQKPAK